MPLLILFALAAAELWVLIQVGSHIGVLATLGLIILCALVGLRIAQLQGLGMVREMQARVFAGQDPGQMASEGAMLMLAAVLLIIPGFITGAAGLLLLVPWIRRGAARLLPRLFAGRVRHVVIDTRASSPGARRERPEHSERPRDEWNVIDVTPGEEKPRELPKKDDRA